MEKKLQFKVRDIPKIKIEGAEFFVDVDWQRLTDMRDMLNDIYFFDLKDHGTHYSFSYDPQKRNIADSNSGGITVEIPQMVNLDPVGMAERYGCDLDSLTGKTDYEIIVNQDLVKRREMGELPVIEIEGYSFIVDIRMGCLRPKDDLQTAGIAFDTIPSIDIEDGFQYLYFAYDPKRHKCVALDERTITAIPEGVVVVEIPTVPQLDPIGFAREYGLDQIRTLREYPPIANMKSKLIPWNYTPIERIIQRNQKKLLERHVIKINNRPKTRIRRGKKL